MAEIISYKMCAVKVRNAKLRNYLKARLHLQFLLRFLLQFSLSNACERVDELRMFGVYVPSSEHS
jgi:hypothetical protein